MTAESKQAENKSTEKSVARENAAEEKAVVKGKKDLAVDSDKKAGTNKTETRSKSSIKKEKAPVSKTALLALFLTLIVGGVAGYEFYLLRIQAKQSQDLSQTQKALQSRINNQEQELRNIHESFAAEINTVKATMDTVSAKLGRTTSAWRLAEVEYLLTVANHRLNLVQDRATAIAVFETADERIQAIGDPGLLSVREAIANELNLLRSMSDPDLTGMALKLSSMAREVEQMPLIFKERVDLATGEKQKDKPESWREIPAAVWEEIKGLVVIRRHQQPTEPLLPPTEAWFLHQNLRLKLEQAQLALLRRDTALFRQNLEEAGIWIETFFDSDSAAVRNATSTLGSLSEVELKLKIPDVSGSLRELRRLLTQRGVALNKNAGNEKTND